ncbi:hypothetical protein M3Y96_00683300 [Aphelenchoides besseyi]|nr:hypothetical protein M3Y96_00683300 [Aphelenchoides besseyi]
MALVYEHAAKLYDEMKQSAGFLANFADQIDLDDSQIPEIMTRIQALVWDLNVPITQEIGVSSAEITPNKHRVSQNGSSLTQIDQPTTQNSPSVNHEVVEQKLKSELNDARAKLLESEAQVADLAQKYANLDEEYEKLMKQNDQLKRENEVLKEQAKENRENSVASTRTLCENVVSINAANFVHSSNDVKTAEHFVEVFESMFKISDQLVQLIKRLDKTENIIEYQPRALNEARHLREIVHQGIDVFRRAKVQPKTLGSNLTAEVAAELKRIYDTMKLVKHNAERPKITNRK